MPIPLIWLGGGLLAGMFLSNARGCTVSGDVIESGAVKSESGLGGATLLLGAAAFAGVAWYVSKR